MSTLFCRHNRFTADCPICSRGTVLDPSMKSTSGARAAGGARGRRSAGTSRAPGPGGGRFAGPYVEAGPYEDDGAQSYRVRLERVPGGVRVGEWVGGQLRRRAPVLPPEALRGLVDEAAERRILSTSDTERLVAALVEDEEAADGEVSYGASRGRAGDLQDELRVEAAGDGSVRVARWMLRPGRGWERHEAAPMLPAARYAEALRGAARAGILGGGRPREGPLTG